jgi:hypothetical protein
VTVWGQDATVSAFVAAQLGYNRPWDNCRAIGFTDANGQLVAGVVFHNWCPEAGTIEMSAASTTRKWLTRKRLAIVFAYPFQFCRIVIARIAEGNKRARRIWRSFGADEYVIPRLRSPNEAEVIYLLPAETWRSGKYGKQAHGQASSAHTP